MPYPRIKELREKNEFTQLETSKLLKIPIATYRSYETGTREPNLEVLVQLSELYKVSVDYILNHTPKEPKISQEEALHIKKYRFLDEHGKQLVDLVLDKEYERRVSEQEEEDTQTNRIVLTMYEDAVSAGTGEFLSDGRCVEVTVNETSLTERADFILRVSGDSMEPTYYDGDKVLVENAVELNVGEIGIFVLNGQGYIKEYRPEGLLSHNQKYEIIQISENDRCEVIGRVIGKI